MMRIVLILCVLIKYSLASECGLLQISNSSPNMVAGEEAYHGDNPWLAALMLNMKGKGFTYICGAMLLNNMTLVTAAHCIQNINGTTGIADHPESYQIILGAHNLTDLYETDRVVRNISQIKINLDFKKDTSDADIAVIIMNEAVEFTPYIQPICLPSFDMSNAGTIGKLTARGLEQQGGQKGSEVPKSSYFTIDSLFECSMSNEAKKTGSKILSKRSFCAKSSNSSLCKGDSGSGFVYNDRKKKQSSLIGLVSHAFNSQCNIAEFTTFVRVAHFVDWIEKNAVHNVYYPNKFQCRNANGTEIGFWEKCDGFDNCGDKSDEKNCIEGTFKDDTFETKRSLVINNGNFTLKSKRNEEIINLKIHNSRKAKFLPIRVGEVFPKLETFRFTTCKAGKVLKENFALLINLKVLNLRDNIIDEIEAGSFEHLDGLEELDLSDNRLTNINGYLFRHLKNLVKLDLKLNEISKLENHIFTSLRKLEKLNLNHNKIESLQGEIFLSNDKLKEVFFIDNEINSISIETFKELNDVKVIDLRNNKCIDKKFSNAALLTSEIENICGNNSKP